jgi:hypothetical protein
MFPYNTQAGSRVDAAAEHSIGKQNRDSESRSKSVEDDYIRLKGVGKHAGDGTYPSNCAGALLSLKNQTDIHFTEIDK